MSDLLTDLKPVESIIGRVYGKLWPGPHHQLPPADRPTVEIKAEVDPRDHMPPAVDQLQIGACTANATARQFRYDRIIDLAQGLPGASDPGELSRRWVYHFEKAIEGTLGKGDTGAIGHDAYKVAKHGIPTEKLYPYSDNIADFEAKPPNVEPRAYRLSRPVRAVPQNEPFVHTLFSNGQTIAFGFPVYESFEDESWWSTGIMPTPDPREGLLGGHEVLACGYLATFPGYTLCLNSWNTSFGIDGYFLMPNSLFLNPQYAGDLRTIQR